MNNVIKTRERILLFLILGTFGSQLSVTYSLLNSRSTIGVSDYLLPISIHVVWIVSLSRPSCPFFVREEKRKRNQEIS